MNYILKEKYSKYFTYFWIHKPFIYHDYFFSKINICLELQKKYNLSFHSELKTVFTIFSNYKIFNKFLSFHVNNESFNMTTQFVWKHQEKLKKRWAFIDVKFVKVFNSSRWRGQSRKFICILDHEGSPALIARNAVWEEMNWEGILFLFFSFSYRSRKRIATETRREGARSRS